MPKWAKYAIVGAVSAVLMDYFVGPTLRKSMGV
jgi:hypothetical protein